MQISCKLIQSLSKGLCCAAVAGIFVSGYLHLKPAFGYHISVDEYKHRLQENFERKKFGLAQASADDAHETLPLPEIPQPSDAVRQPEDLSGFAMLSESPPPPVPDAARNPFWAENARLPEARSDLLSKRSGYLSFPPTGVELGEIPAKIFYPLQQRYADVTVKLIFNSKGVYIYGSGMFETEKDRTVLLVPCIFMQEIPFSRYGHSLVSPLEQELSDAVQISRELEFYPWARYATSHLECQDSLGKFRISIQFGNTEQDVYISLAVPFTTDDKNALFDLADKSAQPCSGLEIFFRTLDLTDLLLKSLQVKNKYFNQEIAELE